MREDWTETAGVRVHFLQAGESGPDVVFLPGGALDYSGLTWKKVARSLPRGYRIFVLDLPGYGRSEMPKTGYATTDGSKRWEATTEVYAGFVTSFFEQHRISNAVLLGASVGGAVAMHLAASETMGARDDDSPPLVRALILSGPHGLRDRLPLHEAAFLLSRPEWTRAARSLLRRRTFLRLALRLVIHDPACINAELVEDALREACRSRSLRAFSAWLRREIQPRSVASNFRGRLGSIDVPVLLLQGRHDWLVPDSTAREAAERFPDARLVMLEAGHMVARERPSESIRAVTDFLARVAPPA